jgi:hypothetical protein
MKQLFMICLLLSFSCLQAQYQSGHVEYHEKLAENALDTSEWAGSSQGKKMLLRDLKRQAKQLALLSYDLDFNLTEARFHYGQ